MPATGTPSAALDAARQYAARGWPVFPVKPRAKVPYFHAADLAHGLKGASTDLSLLLQWWGRWPGANVGIATGSTVVVLDVDLRTGGYETLHELEAEHGPLPETPRALTGGGGLHFYLSAFGLWVPTRIGLAPGIDFKGVGGYVVTPPSVHETGRSYEWEVGFSPDDVPLAPVPRWLLERLKGGAADRLRIDGAPLVIHWGARNHRLHQFGCLLRRYGLGERAILGCLEVINREHATPPLDPEEVARIAASAVRYTPVPNPFLASAAFPRRAPQDDAFEAVVGAALRTSS
jgi:putative DNA primase/helicase